MVSSQDTETHMDEEQEPYQLSIQSLTSQTRYSEHHYMPRNVLRSWRTAEISTVPALWGLATQQKTIQQQF